MRRVLVTGAAGFVGSHCLPPLLARGFEVHAVSRRPRTADRRVGWHQADLLKASERERLLAESSPTDLLHAAWDARPEAYTDHDVASDWRAASVALTVATVPRGPAPIVPSGRGGLEFEEVEACRGGPPVQR